MVLALARLLQQRPGDRHRCIRLVLVAIAARWALGGIADSLST